ncbi:phage tail assembly protein T [Streptomyces microflavus]|uniref:phage tail assembly protein T n=1 Tax=Streptomyces microflavus TaxID=1919 RepID=UPI0033E317BC
MPELLARCTSAELAEWMAYEHVAGPLGPERGDLLHGMLCATVANANRGKGKKAEPKDFIPKWDQGAKREPMDWRQMLASVTAMNRRMGGTDRREGGQE